MGTQTTMRASYGDNRYGGMGEEDYIVTSRGDGPKPPLIVCHGRGDTAVGMLSRPDWAALYRDLAERYVVSVADLGGPTAWGNTRTRQAIEAIRTQLVDAGAANTKIGLVGISMGNLAAMNYAKYNPAGVAFVAGIAPLLSIGYLYSQYSAEVNAALGVTYNDATHGPTYSPHAYRASYPAAAVRTALWMSPADEVVGPHFPAEMKAAQPAIETYGVSGNPNHLDSVPAIIARGGYPTPADWCNFRRVDTAF